MWRLLVNSGSEYVVEGIDFAALDPQFFSIIETLWS